MKKNGVEPKHMIGEGKRCLGTLVADGILHTVFPSSVGYYGWVLNSITFEWYDKLACNNFFRIFFIVA